MENKVTIVKLKAWAYDHRASEDIEDIVAGVFNGVLDSDKKEAIAREIAETFAERFGTKIPKRCERNRIAFRWECLGSDGWDSYTVKVSFKEIMADKIVY